MPQPYQAVFFDLDGTLLDTSTGIYHGLDHTLKYFGETPLPDAEKAKFIGPPLSETFSQFLGYSGEKLKEAIAVYRGYNAEKGYREVVDYPGVRALLKALKARGVKTAVVTMKNHAMALKTLESAGLDSYFDIIQGNSDIAAASKAELIEKTARALETDPGSVLLLGDTYIDAAGAKAAGADFAAAMYGFGYTHGDSPDGYACAAKISAPSEILTILERQ